MNYIASLIAGIIVITILVLLIVFIPVPESSADTCSISILDENCDAERYCMTNLTNPQCQHLCVPNWQGITPNYEWCNQYICDIGGTLEGIGVPINSTFTCQCTQFTGRNSWPSECSKALCGFFI